MLLFKGQSNLHPLPLGGLQLVMLLKVWYRAVPRVSATLSCLLGSIRSRAAGHRAGWASGATWWAALLSAGELKPRQ